MTGTVFTKVDYDLGSLVKYIELGEIGLPDIQRPFVWKNAKVRDLFDSMYRGYPVGYLLLWRNGEQGDRAIGADPKQKTPSLVIVDGQQRLTSLYAVIRGVPIVRENGDTERISIAFNPIEERLEVADAAIRRDPAFIPDISRIWSTDANVFQVTSEFLDRLRASRPVSDEETRTVQDSISRLQTLLSYPFTALELAPDISEEDVSDVFVRINSKGTPLNQADFILTLMSVFWDDGRAELEQFCRDARTPTTDVASPFNHYIEPSPDQLLRVTIGVAFKRARLQHVYSILRGKDLETSEFSATRREAQFQRLRKAQEQTLDLQHWHEFLNCVRQAGFRSKRMISSNHNLLFSYMLYLIGRTEYSVSEPELRSAVAQWFFMSAVTGRFTSSPESAMEFDLARLRGAVGPEEFLSRLRQVCVVTLTNDYWSVSLPNDLATSSPRSPSLFAYNAALVLLDARALFSRTRVAELLDPSIQSKREFLERHHLFPKAHLKALGITGTRETNQIANYAYVEWSDNAHISDRAPADYLSEKTQEFSETEIAAMYHYHALPFGWEDMDYSSFLEARRELMAQVIREGYETLTTDASPETALEQVDVAATIAEGESESVEYKSTLRMNLHTGQADSRMELAVLKSIVGFLNTDGGTLVVGVNDHGEPIGLEADRFGTEDQMSLHLVNIVRSRMGPQVMTLLRVRFEDYRGRRVMIVACPRSASPVYVKDGDIERFYVRTGPSTTELSASQTQDYLAHRRA